MGRYVFDCPGHVVHQMVVSVLMHILKCNYSVPFGNCEYVYFLVSVCVQLVVFGDDVNVAKAATGLPFLASRGSCM